MFPAQVYGYGPSQGTDALNEALKRFAQKPSSSIYKPNITVNTKSSSSKPFKKQGRAESTENLKPYKPTFKAKPNVVVANKQKNKDLMLNEP